MMQLMKGGSRPSQGLRPQPRKENAGRVPLISLLLDLNWNLNVQILRAFEDDEAGCFVVYAKKVVKFYVLIVCDFFTAVCR